MFDPIQDNVSFHMNSDLNNLTKTFGNAVVDLRILLLKRNIVVHKKLIGEGPIEEQSLQICGMPWIRHPR